MSGSVDASRRHGWFDARLPTHKLRGGADRLAPGAVDPADVPLGLDWDAFSTRCFPGGRRHDLEAVSAYYTYRHDREAEEDAQAAQARNGTSRRCSSR
jgi:hypothetical protein